MDGLLIREPWIDYIFQGKKTWEIRGSNTKKRGKIALIKSGTGLIYGTVDLVDSILLSHKEYREGTEKHAIPYADTRFRPYKKTYAWVFENPVLFEKPQPYHHPSGAVIWVKLGDLLEEYLETIE